MKTPIIAMVSKAQGDGSTQVRVVQPLRELKAGQNYDVHVYADNFNIDWPEAPGIIITHFDEPSDENIWKTISVKCENGWVWINDVDTDPRLSDAQTKTGFRAIACAHANTASSLGLAEICQNWNANCHVVHSQIGPMPPEAIAVKDVDDPKVLLIGQPPIKGDFSPRIIADTLLEHADHVEVFCLNDVPFAKFLNGRVPVKALSTQPYGAYLKLLDHVDIAIYALADNAQNTLVSDLPIVECLAHGVVPVVSRFAANKASIPFEFMQVVKDPIDWAWRLNELLDEPSDLRAKKAAGYEFVSSQRLWKEHALDLEVTYDKVVANWKKLEVDRQGRVAKRKADGLSH